MEDKSNIAGSESVSLSKNVEAFFFVSCGFLRG